MLSKLAARAPCSKSYSLQTGSYLNHIFSVCVCVFRILYYIQPLMMRWSLSTPCYLIMATTPTHKQSISPLSHPPTSSFLLHCSCYIKCPWLSKCTTYWRHSCHGNHFIHKCPSGPVIKRPKRKKERGKQEWERDNQEERTGCVFILWSIEKRK